MSARDLSRIKKTYAPDLDAATDLHFDIGNPLLASLGTQGRDFLYMLAELECDVRENYAQPARRSLLTNLQADILDMMDAREKVAHMWLVNPQQQTLEVFRLQGDGWFLVTTYKGDASVRAEPFDAVELSLGSLWEL